MLFKLAAHITTIGLILKMMCFSQYVSQDSVERSIKRCLDRQRNKGYRVLALMLRIKSVRQGRSRWMRSSMIESWTLSSRSLRPCFFTRPRLSSFVPSVQGVRTSRENTNKNHGGADVAQTGGKHADMSA